MRKDNLQELIDLLSPPEKQYIAKYLAVSGKTNPYYLLFKSLISGQKIKKKENKAKDDSNNAYYLKRNQLKNKVLQYLRANHQNENIEQKLKNDLINIEILYRKGATELCNRMIKEALKLSEINELFDLELSFLTFKIYTLSNLKETKRPEMEEFLQKKDNLILKIQDLNNYSHLMYDAYFFMNEKVMIKGNKQLSLVRKKLANYESKMLEPSSKTALMYQLQTLLVYNMKLNNYSSSYKYAVKYLETIKEFRRISARSFDRNLSIAYRNVIIIELYLKKDEKARSTLNECRRLKLKSTREEDALQLYVCTVELELTIREGGFTKADKLDADTEKVLAKYERIQSKDKPVIFYSMAYICFGAGLYKKALKWINLFLNDKVNFKLEDTYTSILILNLIIHYHQKDFQMLEYLILSTYRYLYKKKRVYKIEGALLTFMKKQIKSDKSEQTLKINLNQLLDEIKKISKDEKDLLTDFDFISWIESKLQNRPFAEIVKERINIAS